MFLNIVRVQCSETQSTSDPDSNHLDVSQTDVRHTKTICTQYNTYQQYVHNDRCFLSKTTAVLKNLQWYLHFTVATTKIKSTSLWLTSLGSLKGKLWHFLHHGFFTGMMPFLSPDKQCKALNTFNLIPIWNTANKYH